MASGFVTPPNSPSWPEAGYSPSLYHTAEERAAFYPPEIGSLSSVRRRLDFRTETESSESETSELLTARLLRWFPLKQRRVNRVVLIVRTQDNKQIKLVRALRRPSKK